MVVQLMGLLGMFLGSLLLAGAGRTTCPSPGGHDQQVPEH